MCVRACLSMYIINWSPSREESTSIKRIVIDITQNPGVSVQRTSILFWIRTILLPRLCALSLSLSLSVPYLSVSRYTDRSRPIQKNYRNRGGQKRRRKHYTAQLLSMIYIYIYIKGLYSFELLVTKNQQSLLFSFFGWEGCRRDTVRGQNREVKVVEGICVFLYI